MAAQPSLTTEYSDLNACGDTAVANAFFLPGGAELVIPLAGAISQNVLDVTIVLVSPWKISFHAMVRENTGNRKTDCLAILLSMVLHIFASVMTWFHLGGVRREAETQVYSRRSSTLH